MPAGIDQKVEIWKNKLLDLGKRNRLINYRETKRSTLSIKTPEIFELWESFVENDNPLEFPYYREPQEETDVEYDIDNGFLTSSDGTTHQNVKEQFLSSYWNNISLKIIEIQISFALEKVFIPILKSTLIMTFALNYLTDIANNAVDESVLSINAATPPTLKVSFQRLRLAYAYISVSLNVFDQHVDALDGLFVVHMPI